MSDLVSNPFAKFEDKADPFVPTATLQIYQFISDYLERKEDGGIDRASAATMCVKRRWYQRKGHPGEPLTPRKLVNFLQGDLAERTLLYFISQALVGLGKLYSEINLGDELGAITFQGKELKIYKQKTLSFMLDDKKITGHADGFGKRNSDGKWELIECKSSANWGFQSFQTEGPGDYIKQSHTLMMMDDCRALDIKESRYYYLRKETGHVWDKLSPWSEDVAKKVVKEFRVARRDEEPEAPFELKEETFRKKPTGRTVAEFPCTYCPYLRSCKGEYQLEWKSDQFGNQRPVYVFHKENKDAV